MVLNLFSAILPGGESEPVPVSESFSPAAMELTLPSRPAPNGVSWSEMDYEHYDTTLFYAGLDALYALADSGDTQGVLAQYDRLYTEFSYVDTLVAIADAHYSTDITDSYWSEESLYCLDIWGELGDALSAACRELLEGPMGDAFSAHIGADAAEYLREYEAMTERETELSQQASRLVNEYFETMAYATETVSYSYLGEPWSFEELNGYAGDSLYDSDPDGYWEISDGLEKAVNDLLGPIFLELVDIRAEMAAIQGYDSYTDYAYESVFGRDYTGEDAQALCDAVKEFSPGYYEDLYYSDLWYSYNLPAPVMDGEELVAALGEHIPLFGEDLTSVWQFMTDHELYELTSDPNCRPGAYTTQFAYYRSPFIYAGLTGDCYDLSTLTHEFGHFADFYFSPTPNLLTSVGSYDLFEIHSTGLEVLFSEQYDAIYTEGADIARFITLGGLLEAVLSGCIQDEFQRRVYENPDMTLEEINRLYAEINAEYGLGDESVTADYSWMYITHNYEAPLYYLSYAVSSLASLQLWNMAQEDFSAAVDRYLAILGQSAYDDGYMQVLKNAGLRLFTEEGAVAEICEPVLQELKRLDRGFN